MGNVELGNARLIAIAAILLLASVSGCASRAATQPAPASAPNAPILENASMNCTGGACEAALRARCCAECHEAYSKSPVAMGPNAARCGHFITGAPLSATCQEYFETDPPAVSRCI